MTDPQSTIDVNRLRDIVDEAGPDMDEGSASRGALSRLSCDPNCAILFEKVVEMDEVTQETLSKCLIILAGLVSKSPLLSHGVSSWLQSIIMRKCQTIALSDRICDSICCLFYALFSSRTEEGVKFVQTLFLGDPYCIKIAALCSTHAIIQRRDIRGYESIVRLVAQLTSMRIDSSLEFTELAFSLSRLLDSATSLAVPYNLILVILDTKCIETIFLAFVSLPPRISFRIISSISNLLSIPAILFGDSYLSFISSIMSCYINVAISPKIKISELEGLSMVANRISEVIKFSLFPDSQLFFEFLNATLHCTQKCLSEEFISDKSKFGVTCGFLSFWASTLDIPISGDDVIQALNDKCAIVRERTEDLLLYKSVDEAQIMSVYSMGYALFAKPLCRILYSDSSNLLSHITTQFSNCGAGLPITIDCASSILLSEKYSSDLSWAVPIVSEISYAYSYQPAVSHSKSFDPPTFDDILELSFTRFFSSVVRVIFRQSSLLDPTFCKSIAVFVNRAISCLGCLHIPIESARTIVECLSFRSYPSQVIKSIEEDLPSAIIGHDFPICYIQPAFEDGMELFSSFADFFIMTNRTEQLFELIGSLFAKASFPENATDSFRSIGSIIRETSDASIILKIQSDFFPELSVFSQTPSSQVSFSFFMSVFCDAYMRCSFNFIFNAEHLAVYSNVTSLLSDLMRVASDCDNETKLNVGMNICRASISILMWENFNFGIMNHFLDISIKSFFQDVMNFFSILPISTMLLDEKSVCLFANLFCKVEEDIPFVMERNVISKSVMILGQSITCLEQKEIARVCSALSTQMRDGRISDEIFQFALAVISNSGEKRSPLLSTKQLLFDVIHEIPQRMEQFIEEVYDLLSSEEAREASDAFRTVNCASNMRETDVSCSLSKLFRVISSHSNSISFQEEI